MKRGQACDYLFLAADSMRARLVFNALVHQYLIPGVQLGSKIRTGTGEWRNQWLMAAGKELIHLP